MGLLLLTNSAAKFWNFSDNKETKPEDCRERDDWGKRGGHRNPNLGRFNKNQKLLGGEGEGS